MATVTKKPDTKEAEKQIIAAYEAKFSQKPNRIYLPIIQMHAIMVANGETFEWRQPSPNFRELHITTNHANPNPDAHNGERKPLPALRKTNPTANKRRSKSKGNRGRSRRSN